MNRSIIRSVREGGADGSIIRSVRVGGADGAFAPPLFGPSYSFKWDKAALKPRFIDFGPSYPTLPYHFQMKVTPLSIMDIFSLYHSWIWLYFQEYIRTEKWRGRVDQEWIAEMVKDLKIRRRIRRDATSPPLLQHHPLLVTCNKELLITDESDDHLSFLVEVDGDFKEMTVIIIIILPLDFLLVDWRRADHMIRVRNSYLAESPWRREIAPGNGI